VVVYPGWNVGAMVSLATGLLLFVAARRDWLTSQGVVWGLPFFGTLSYSFYLIHKVVLARLTRGADRLGLERGISVLVVVVVGAAASLLAAYLLFRFVELPCVRLSKRFKRPVSAASA
jgi:peptidoglycan/LPS O-acetylase OafA/YrhL